MVRKITSRLNNSSVLESISLKITKSIGTPVSIVIHTLLFTLIFFLRFLGVSVSDILLVLTTAVSLEAIYLAIFIQMTVNRNTQSLEAVEDDIEEIQEDVEDLEDDIEEISEEKQQEQSKALLGNLESHLLKIQEDLELLKKKGLI